MLLLVGAGVVILSVMGGYLLEGGNLLLIVQPNEFLIIGGAAAGTLVLSTPLPLLKATLAQIKGLFGSGPKREDFASLLAMLYQLFRVVQQSGVMALETHIENPSQSAILGKYKTFLQRHTAVAFLADSVKVIIVGGMSPHDFDSLMTEDLEVRHKDALQPSATLAKVGDALPGLGIVAAVLGIVNTMQAINGPPAEIGQKVGAALVGTFLGILLSYGFVQPLATSLEHRVNEEAQFEQCIKAGLLALHKGSPPAIAVEFARRVIPEEIRPTFEAAEQLCRTARTEAQAA
jgi:chemotaxis protein MotA